MDELALLQLIVDRLQCAVETAAFASGLLVALIFASTWRG